MRFKNTCDDALIGSGSTSGVKFFAGSLAEAFYPVAPSAAQVAAHPAAGLR